MIKIDLIEPDDPAWRRWRAESASKTEELIKGGKPYHVTAYYKNKREQLFKAFHFKCVYCECSLRPGQIGDVEHFRPKGAVADLDFKTIYIDAAGKEAHPGYYWLVYDVSNLLPACQLCNESGLGGGKRERFPLLDEAKRAKAPGEEIHEEPALINPAAEDPYQHFVLCTETGTLGLRTPRAEACEKIFNLNREDLCIARWKAYWRTRANVKAVLNESLGDAQEYRRLMEELKDAKSGVSPFAMAARKALRDTRVALQDLFDVLLPLME
jgi:hypothetical protein